MDCYKILITILTQYMIYVTKAFLDPYFYFADNKLVMIYFYLVLSFFTVKFSEIIFNSMSK